MNKNTEHIYMLIRYLTSTILILTSLTSFSQIIDKGQSHFKTRWKQINTEKFQLIFPESFTETASSLSDKINNFIEITSQDLQIQPQKISIIIDNNHLEQNGFVQLAPRKTEIYPVPGSTSTNEEWLPNLLIHEMRHIAQFDKMTGKFKKPFFEQLGLALFGIHVPSWFFEGDAVEIETRLTSGGRGRSSSWKMPILADIKDEKTRSFNTYLLGSYKEYVPSFYTIGYLMNQNLVEEKGVEIKEKIFDEMQKHKLRPFNFDRSLKKYYGGNAHFLFKNTVENLRNSSKIFHIGETQNDSSEKINTPKPKYYTHYYLPQTTDGTHIFTLASGPEKRNQIVKISYSESLEKIVEPGIQATPYFHIKGNKILWDEVKKHARYTKNTYSTIQIYDVKSRKQKQLTSKTRYFSPYFHPTKDEFIVTHVNLDNESRILSLNLDNGQQIDELFYKKGWHLQQAAYDSLGQKIVCIALTEKGNTLIEIDVNTKEYRKLLPWSNTELERPQYHGDIIIFKAGFEGKDQLFLLDGDQVSQISDAENGAFKPSIYKNSVYFNVYERDGYKVRYINLKDLNREASGKTIDHLRSTHNEQEFQFSQTDSSSHSIKNYSSFSHIFNFHSLSLSSNNFDNFDNFKPGIFWYANDLLNQSQIKLGYEYDLDLGKSNYSAEWLYQKYPPIFTFKYKNRGQMAHALVKERPDSMLRLDWREHVYSAEISLPFSTYSRNFTKSYGVNFGTSYIERYNLNRNNISNFKNTLKFPLNYQVYFQKNQMRSRMDLGPRWGYGFSLLYRHTPLEASNDDIFSFRTNFYFPGIKRNHSLHLRYGMQFGKGIFSISNDIPLATGYEFLMTEKLDNTLLADYSFPLAYPDWSMGRWAYIKRIYSTVFSDFQNIHTNYSPAVYGIGIYGDMNFLRFPLPDFNLGFKIAKLNTPLATRDFAFYYTFSYSY